MQHSPQQISHLHFYASEQLCTRLSGNATQPTIDQPSALLPALGLCKMQTEPRQKHSISFGAGWLQWMLTRGSQAWPCMDHAQQRNAEEDAHLRLSCSCPCVCSEHAPGDKNSAACACLHVILARTNTALQILKDQSEPVVARNHTTVPCLAAEWTGRTARSSGRVQAQEDCLTGIPSRAPGLPSTVLHRPCMHAECLQLRAPAQAQLEHPKSRQKWLCGCGCHAAACDSCPLVSPKSYDLNFTRAHRQTRAHSGSGYRGMPR